MKNGYPIFEWAPNEPIYLDKDEADMDNESYTPSEDEYSDDEWSSADVEDDEIEDAVDKAENNDTHMNKHMMDWDVSASLCG